MLLLLPLALNIQPPISMRNQFPSIHVAFSMPYKSQIFQVPFAHDFLKNVQISASDSTCVFSHFP